MLHIVKDRARSAQTAWAVRRSTGRLAFEPLERRLVLDAGPAVISEFLAVNDGVFPDGDGDFSDWIEIYNPTDARVELGGWHLTDDAEDLAKWQFPDVSLPAGGYLMVFASGKAAVGPAGELHTNFQLDGGGEYLALVRADGATVASEFAPEFPSQRTDVSYGTTHSASAFALEAGRLTYHVPSESDGPLGTAWTGPGFDDSAWDRFIAPPPVLITEAGTADPDYVEIQNLAQGPMETAGWAVAVNNAFDVGRAADINAFHATLWELPASMAPDEVLYRSDIDDGSGNFWGENIFWRTTASGWVLLLDDAGDAVDFVVWGYSDAEIASFDVTIGGHRVTSADLWTGPAVPKNPSVDYSLQRTGIADHDDASDWGPVDPWSMAVPNEGLTSPFPVAEVPGLGFETNPPGLAAAVGIDLAAAMHGVNASLWTRVPFQVDDPTVFDAMQLQAKYNDGLVAYINGQEVARRNAPEVLGWDSAATAARDVDQSLAFEEIDISGWLAVLRPGANLLAVHALNVDAADGNLLTWPRLVVTGARFFDPPTPQGPNGDGYSGLVKDTSFSIDRGFYTEPLTVEITTNTPGATVYYSLDGSLPTEETGVRYTGPVSIDTTTTLRAAAFRPDYLPTNVDTHTYIFVEHVPQQDGAGFPLGWGEPSVSLPGRSDYEVDPEIALSPVYQDRLIEGLKSIPSMSVVLPVDDVFGRSGLYANPLNTTMEKAASAELIYPDGSEGFQVDAGLKIQGGASRQPEKAPKHSLSLRFRNIYGPGRLNFPLFEDWPVTRFNTIQMRAMFNNSWIHWAGTQRARGQMIRDQWVRDSLIDMGQQDAGQGNFMHLYINGLYWGLYNVHERQEASHYAQYNGGDDDRLDAFNATSLIDGTRASWDAMRTTVAGRNWDNIQQVLDVDNYIDWTIIQRFAKNTDLKDNGNWRVAGGGPEGAPWRFYSWDSEHVLENVADTSVPSPSADPTGLLSYLDDILEFRVRFADRLHKHLFNDGALTPPQNTDRWMQRANEIDLAIIGESARWGDYRRDVHSWSSGPYELYTRDDHWVPHQALLIDGYFPTRTDRMITRYRSDGLYPDVDAPVYYVGGGYQHGGQIAEADLLSMAAAAGTIHYTLDGSDPRLPGGNISPDALVFEGNAFSLSQSAPVNARARDGGAWSALNEAQFFVERPASAENLLITEINYNPYPPTDEELAAGFVDNEAFEFIELTNVSNDPVVMVGAALVDGVRFGFDAGTVRALWSGQSLVVVQDPVAFAARYPGAGSVAGRYDGRLDNGGEQIQLRDFFGKVIAGFSYDSDGNWPGRADGKGASLELIDPALVPTAEPQRTDFLSDDDNWRSSSEYGGSPGTAGSGPAADVVVNEVLINTPLPMLDAIELHNTTGAEIDIGGWYLSDSWGWAGDDANGNYKKFRIPDGRSIPPGGYLVFDERHFNPSGGMDPDLHPDDFALDGDEGDDVWLMEADIGGELIRFVDHVEFQAATEGESFGRWPNATGRMYPLQAVTLGRQNSGPRVGPLILSELHYNPLLVDPDGDLEFVEIYNPTGRSIDLTEWRIRGGVDYDFPAGGRLGPYSTLVVVPFDLTDAEKLTAFYEAYWPGGTLPDGLLLAGGYSGQLDDGGERVQLQRPGGEVDGQIPRLLEDEVRYDDLDPWPPQADGGGDSLQRRATDAWGHDYQSWDALPPKPGEVPFPVPQAEVVARYVFYNGSQFDADGGDDAAIAPDKQALLPGGTATFANYTSYSRGLDGIIIDVAGLPEGAALGTGDFRFRVGNDDHPDAWGIAPNPSEIAVRPGDGVDGSARITLAWPEGAIQKQWLQVTVLPGEATGLAQADVFYFGNAIGETGNSTTEAKVTVADMLGARDNQRGFLNPAPIDFAFDFDRDTKVSTVDMLIARNNQTHFLSALRLITVPGGKAAAADHSVAREAGGRQSRADTLAWLYEYEGSTASPPQDKDDGPLGAEWKQIPLP